MKTQTVDARNQDLAVLAVISGQQQQLSILGPVFV